MPNPTSRRYTISPTPSARSTPGRECAAPDRNPIVSGGSMERIEWPSCLKCSKGSLIPLSDYGREGAPITYKAWVCTNPDCGFNLRIDNGETSLGRAIGQSYKCRPEAPADGRDPPPVRVPPPCFQSSP